MTNFHTHTIWYGGWSIGVLTKLCHELLILQGMDYFTKEYVINIKVVIEEMLWLHLIKIKVTRKDDFF